MALIRWQPRESFALQRELGNLLDTWTGYGTGWHPRVDVAESENDFTVHAELPGLRKEDIQVTLEDNMLTITGERKYRDEQKDKQFYRRERAYGTFKRTFGLGTEVEVDKIAATYKNGLLILTLPKSEAAKPRQIDVTVS